MTFFATMIAIVLLGLLIALGLGEFVARRLSKRQYDTNDDEN